MTAPGKTKKKPSLNPLRSTPSSKNPHTHAIDSLRTYYHSVHEHDRAEVIEILGSLSDPNARRELIQLYQECQWRNSKLQIIRALSKHPSQRSLEFLFKIAQLKSDITLAETAIWSLGQSHHPMAALFLVHLYPQSSEALKPGIVAALGQIPDRTLLKTFLAELPDAVKNHQTRLARNLVLTLGELKAHEALPIFLALTNQQEAPEIRLSALIGIGKIARDPKMVENLERRFSDDLFHYQLFTSVKNQVQFRAKWKLEDYLNKFFETTDSHATLPYELNHFDASEVKAGLKLYAKPAHFEKLCLALSKLDFPEIAAWYAEFFELSSLNAEQCETLLQSMSMHHSEEMLKPLAWVKKQRPEVVAAWLKAITLSIPESKIELKAYFESKDYKESTEDQRITAINQLYQRGSMIQSNSSQLQEVESILETLFETDPSEAVQGRILRALGSLEMGSKKTFLLIKDHLKKCFESQDLDTALGRSLLKYLEQCPEKSVLPLLQSVLERLAQATNLQPQWKTAFLKALAAQGHLPSDDPHLDLFLKKCLAPNETLECKTAALNFLKNHPRRNLLPEVLGALETSEPIQLAAIIALKSMNDESTAEHLGRFLSSPQRSLAGRALDTLSTLPGMRARRLMVDHLNENAEDLEVCDKIIRSFTPLPTPTDYFSNVIRGILERLPHHPLKDGLVQLQEKVSATNSRPGVSTLTKGVDIQAIDQVLRSKLQAYESYDESIKSILRSAEVPYQHRKLFDEYVDKSSCVVEYCKGVDLLLEKTLGKKLFFPKLERALHEFQNLLHGVGLNETNPSSEVVLAQLELEKHFTARALPLHKMTLLAQAILNGRILDEHFKTMDGLRAWGVILLLFSRKIKSRKPIIPIEGLSGDQIVNLSKRLMALQDIRNPFAHRQTVVQFTELDEIRNEVFSVLNLIPGSGVS